MTAAPRKKAGRRQVQSRTIAARPPEVARLVLIFFHSDRYSGRCELLDPQPSSENGKVVHKALYTSEPIRKLDGEELWACGFPQRSIPVGSYILAVPCGQGKNVYHRVKIDYKFENVDGHKTTDAAEPVLLKDGKQRFQFEFLIGDAYSLEETILHHFSHIYADNILQLLKGVITGESDESVGAFKAVVNQIKSIHDGVSTMFDTIKLDNKYFKAIRNVKEIFDDVWGTSNFKKMQDAIEQAKLADLPEELKDEAVSKFGLKEWQEGFDVVTKPLEIMGKVLEIMDSIEAAGNLFNALDAERKTVDALSAFMRQHLRGLYNGDFNRCEVRSFNRSEMKQLEVLKQAADQAGGDALMAGLEFTWGVSSLLIGFAFPGGWLASLGKTAENLGKVAEVVQLGLETLDEQEVNQYWSSTLREIKEDMHMSFCRVTNYSELKHRMIGRGPADEWESNRYIEFLQRSKVLYGLLELVERCGSPEESPAEFKKMVTSKVKSGGCDIQGYIENLILKPFWVKNEYLLSSWTRYYHFETDDDDRNQVIKLTDPNDPGAWWKVDFHQHFPIHHCEHTDMVELAKWLSVDYGGVSEDQIEAVFWQFATAGFQPKQNDGVDLTSVTSWTDFADDDEINSETPVRVVVIFNEKIRMGVPVTFQLVRTDYSDIKGPGYSTTTRRTRKDDHLPSKYSQAKICAIAELDYSWDGRVYHGIRPFGVHEVQAASAYERGKFGASPAVHEVVMDMTVQISIGRGEITGCVPEDDQKDAKLAWRYWKNFQEVKLVPYLKGDPKNKDKKFLDRDFLEKYK